MARQTAEERKLEYLKAGANMLTDFSPEQAGLIAVEALANVKVSDVAERAGVTKGAVYHIWPTQEDFRKDLLRRLLQQNHQAAVTRMLELIAAAKQGNGDPTQAMSQLAGFLFDSLKDDPAFFARFNFYVYTGNPEIRAILAAEEDQTYEDFGPYVDLYLKILGRRFRTPFTTRVFLTTTGALLHGLCMRYRISPELTDVPLGAQEEAINMYAFSFTSILNQFSEEIPG